MDAASQLVYCGIDPLRRWSPSQRSISRNKIRVRRRLSRVSAVAAGPKPSRTTSSPPANTVNGSSRSPPSKSVNGVSTVTYQTLNSTFFFLILLCGMSLNSYLVVNLVTFKIGCFKRAQKSSKGRCNVTSWSYLLVEWNLYPVLAFCNSFSTFSTSSC